MFLYRGWQQTGSMPIAGAGPTEAIVRVLKACVCGSDLWWFRGINEREHGSLVGHEAIGIVDEVGSGVHDMKPGDFVIVPFTHACSHCVACEKGYDGNCSNMSPAATPAIRPSICARRGRTRRSSKSQDRPPITATSGSRRCWRFPT